VSERTRSSAAASAARSLRWIEGSSRPIIISASSRALLSAGRQLATTRPPRMTVARSQSARISSSLWLM